MLIDDNLLMCLDFKIPHKQLGRRIKCEVRLNYVERPCLKQQNHKQAFTVQLTQTESCS